MGVQDHLDGPGRRLAACDAAVRAFFSSRRVLVTGAAGSIGQALTRALAALDCAHLALLDHVDHGLLEVCESVRRAAPRLPITELLCDVRDRVQLARAMDKAEPDIVIHAAALKHVHLGERHPTECVLTNLLGARNVLHAAAVAGARDFLLVSTDKAAAPACVMGATKRLAELYLCGFEREQPMGLRLKSVRFGNVVGTQGSVLPRFKAQIAGGGPLEITHPDMERFFMSEADAVRLILTVAAFDDPGAGRAASYYLDMGEQVRIVDIAEKLIRESGRAIDIVYTGKREGEKLRESLFDAHESAAATALADVHRVVQRSPHAWVSSADLTALESAIRERDDAEVREAVFALLGARLGATLTPPPSYNPAK
jgi:O-antigen biosynthesis protein WbqV